MVALQSKNIKRVAQKKGHGGRQSEENPVCAAKEKSISVSVPVRDLSKESVRQGEKGRRGGLQKGACGQPVYSGGERPIGSIAVGLEGGQGPLAA